MGEGIYYGKRGLGVGKGGYLGVGVENRDILNATHSNLMGGGSFDPGICQSLAPTQRKVKG